MIVKQFHITGKKTGSDEFSHPSLAYTSFATFQEALQDAKEWHEQFGDAYAIWFRERIVGVYDLRGHIPLDPEFR